MNTLTDTALLPLADPPPGQVEAGRGQGLLHLAALVLTVLILDQATALMVGPFPPGGWTVGRLIALVVAALAVLAGGRECGRIVWRHQAALRSSTEATRAVPEGEGQAALDSLTRLPRQALLVAQLRRLQAQHQAGQTLTVLFIDLDGFRHVNDSRGFLMGDLVLTQVADVLRRVIRAGDLVGRHGGDEFVLAVLTPQAQQEATVARIAAQVIEGVGQLNQGIGCSVGICQASDAAVDAEALVRQADAAMGQAKGRGRNQVQTVAARPEAAEAV